MALRAEGYLAIRPWLDTTPVSQDNGHLLNIGHMFMGLLGVVEVAVELLPDVSAEVLFELDSARTSMSNTPSARPVLVGSLLRALDDAGDAVDGLLDWVCTTQTADAAALVQKLAYERALEAALDLYSPTATVAGSEHG